MTKTEKLWLIGCGPMSKAYAKVLAAQNESFSALGRGSISSNAFQDETGVFVISGGLEHALNQFPVPEQAIVAVGVDQLSVVAKLLLDSGCKRILLEKPGALKFSDLSKLNQLAKHTGAEISIGYNRRFFASVQKLLTLVELEGGIRSAIFEFTEWSHEIQDLEKGEGVKERWLLSNSSHVIDLAFHLIGIPGWDTFSSYCSGALPWHPSASQFHGAGLSERQIPFAYYSDWQAPGRWGLEVMTKANRYILKPMERLSRIPLGSVHLEDVNCDYSLDILYKPGLFLQCREFLRGSNTNSCTIAWHMRAFEFYCRMAGYSSD